MEEQKDKKVDAKKGNKVKDGAKVGVVIAASAALFFGCIFAIQNGLNQDPSVNIGVTSQTSTSTNKTSTSDNVVVDVYDPMKEVVNKPVKSDVEIGRYFYDSKDPIENRQNAMIQISEGVYQKSDGVDYKSSTGFDVFAVFSGKVIKVANDSTYGNMVFIQHESGIIASYSSLGKVNVIENQEVKQDDVIGSSGESNYTSGLEQSLHFTIEKDGSMLNPTKSYGQLVKGL